ncbi:hypothetical protein [Carnobacterium gallinarum]|uniref:hypothetical protein n=1 Tax=Carnobacterium gallinarum TaxID=2749 RepID=UPI00054DA2B8|nr:hypothetical protein [Carnobacterium gallinarum]
MPTLGRDKTLRQLFDTDDKYNNMNHHELMAVIWEKVETNLKEIKNDIDKLAIHCQELTHQYKDIHQKKDEIYEQGQYFQRVVSAEAVGHKSRPHSVRK